MRVGLCVQNGAGLARGTICISPGLVKTHIGRHQCRAGKDSSSPNINFPLLYSTDAKASPWTLLASWEPLDAFTKDDVHPRNPLEDVFIISIGCCRDRAICIGLGPKCLDGWGEALACHQKTLSHWNGKNDAKTCSNLHHFFKRGQWVYWEFIRSFTVGLTLDNLPK